MDDKLNLLIEYYAGEVSNLQQLIKEELDTEENYLAASWYQRGLWLAQNQYNKLNTLNEPFLSEKERLLKRIEWIKEKRSGYEEGDESHLRFSIMLEFAEEEYKSLGARDLPEKIISQPNLFEEAIDKVFAKEIKGVNLIINESIGLRFEITSKRNKATLAIPCRKRRGKSAWFDEYELRRLAKLGFEVKKKPLRVVKSFQFRPKEAANMKTCLARCYFGILNPSSVQNQGYIEYVY
ncbi:hypothetical protein ACTJIJ_11320 [Niabella sp. 22666]|uniref:hypothetical protein n=1 Tax=Niabella sp. 22666 TaxID=3453954 RepID=UPI003F862E54